MSLDSLDKLLLQELKDIYSAEKLIVRALTARGKKCKGMEGLLAEGKEMVKQPTRKRSCRYRTAGADSRRPGASVA